jgi:hypothetical protein
MSSRRLESLCSPWSVGALMDPEFVRRVVMAEDRDLHREPAGTTRSQGSWQDWCRALVRLGLRRRYRC